jgi:hypothetical protein
MEIGDFLDAAVCEELRAEQRRVAGGERFTIVSWYRLSSETL